MRGLRIVGIVLGLAVAAAGVAVGVVLVGGNRITAWAIEHPISSYIGRKVTVAGPVSVHWGSPTRLSFQDLRIANAPWGTAPDMFTAGRVTVEFHPGSLFSGRKNFPLVSLDHAKLLLETSKQGERNWSFLDKILASNPRRQFPILKHFVAKDSAITFRNGTTGAVNRLIANQAELEAPTPTAPVKVGFQGSLQGQPLRIAGTVGPLGDLRNPAKPYPVDLHGAFGQSTLVVQGTMQKPLSFSGLDLRVSLEGKGLQKLAATLDIPLPPLPDFRATGVMTGGAGDWTLKALSAKVGASDLEGGVGIDLKGKRPYLQANLTSGYLDLADFAGFLGAKPPSAPASGSSAPETPARIISAKPIAVDRLQYVNADVGLEAGKLQASKGLPLERVSASLHLKNGVLELKPLDFAIAHGTVDFGLRLDDRQRPPQLKLDLDIRHVDLHRLIADMKLSPTLKKTSGVVGGFVHFTSDGTSLRDFLGRMNGKAALFLENGRLSQLLQEGINLDVLEALGLLATGDRETPVNCLVSGFNLRQGVATVGVGALDTTDTLVTVSGNFNFAAETIYLDVVPYDKSFTFLTLHTPVDVRGTFAKPSYSFNKTKIAERIGAAVVLGVLLPPVGELLPFIETGLGKDNACARAFTALKSSATR